MKNSYINDELKELVEKEKKVDKGIDFVTYKKNGII